MNGDEKEAKNGESRGFCNWPLRACRYGLLEQAAPAVARDRAGHTEEEQDRQRADHGQGHHCHPPLPTKRRASWMPGGYCRNSLHFQEDLGTGADWEVWPAADSVGCGQQQLEPVASLKAAVLALICVPLRRTAAACVCSRSASAAARRGAHPLGGYSARLSSRASRGGPSARRSA
jgi:hypothetical protein